MWSPLTASHITATPVTLTVRLKDISVWMTPWERLTDFHSIETTTVVPSETARNLEGDPGQLAVYLKASSHWIPGAMIDII